MESATSRPKEAQAVITIRLPLSAYTRLAEESLRDEVRPSTQAQRILVRALRGRRRGSDSET